MQILGTKYAAKFTGFHHIMLVSNLTGLDTLTKVYQVNWRQPKIALSELVHNNPLVILFATTFILCVLLLIDFTYHYSQRKATKKMHSVAINNGLVVLFYFNSVALFIAYMTASSNMDKKKEASTTFIRVTTVYAVPSLLFLINFFFSLACYKSSDILENIERQIRELEHDINETRQLLDEQTQATKKPKTRCIIM